MAKFTRVKNDKSGSYLFQCPGCQCSHQIWTEIGNREKGPVWTFNGDVDRPTCTPSLRVRYKNTQGSHVCHSYIKEGKIQFLGDCTHDLKGQTVDIPDWNE